jgi:hypothetical protein
VPTLDGQVFEPLISKSSLEGASAVPALNGQVFGPLISKCPFEGPDLYGTSSPLSESRLRPFSIGESTAPLGGTILELSALIA